MDPALGPRSQSQNAVSRRRKRGRSQTAPFCGSRLFMATLAQSFVPSAAPSARQRRAMVLRVVLLSPAGLMMLAIYGYALLIFTGYSFYTFESGKLVQEFSLHLDRLSDRFVLLGG